jgi:hypothetical protein
MKEADMNVGLEEPSFPSHSPIFFFEISEAASHIRRFPLCSGWICHIKCLKCPLCGPCLITVVICTPVKEMHAYTSACLGVSGHPLT